MELGHNGKLSLAENIFNNPEGPDFKCPY